MALSVLTDAPVTNSQTAGNPLADGANLYVATCDYADPSGDNDITVASLHVFKSSNNGVTWGEQDAAHKPTVFSTTSAVYGSPAIPPFLVIDTKVFFNAPTPLAPVPPYQLIPFLLAPGLSPDDGYGNDTLLINLLEYGYVVASVSLVVDGTFGVSTDPNSIAAPLAAALNAQLAALSISPSTLQIGVGPGAIPFNHTGFSEQIDDSALVIVTSFTGSNWAIAATGDMLQPYDPPVLQRCQLHVWNAFLPDITIFNTVGVNANLNPIPILFNTFSPAAISNHVIYLAFIGLDQTVNIARYNTLTDTWMSTISGGPPVTMIVYDPSLGTNLNLRFYAVLKVRSTGDIVIAMAVGSNVGSAANFPATYWAVYSGGAWGSATLITSANLNVPAAAVVDTSDNVAFIINMGGGNSGGNPFVSTFIVKNDNTTVALADVDASPTAFSAIPLSQGNLLQGVQGVFLQSSGVILLVIGSTSPGGSVAQAYEITMTSLLAAGSWTKMSRTWANGIDQYVGAVDGTFWQNQFYAIFNQGSNPSSGLWNSNIGLGVGNSTGGSADSSFGAAVAILSTTGGATVNRIIFATMAVVMSNGNLGIAYSYIDFINTAPNYYTRFAVIAPPMTASCNTPPSGSTGGPYTHAFTASGGNPPYTWTLASGSLPTGLTLNAATGILSGIPTAAATYSFSLTATDSSSTAVTISCSITITGPFSAGCGSASGGTVGSSYTQTLTTSGGVSAFTWSLLSGALPTGTTLNASTGVISGTLTTAGRYYFTLKVTDSTGNFAIVSCFAQVCPSGV